MGNGRQNHKFSSLKNRGGILLYCAGAGGNTCGRKLRGDEKQLIDLEWPNCCETVSKCLARVKGCWNPEFEPSVEEIVDYR